jgi:hypothetical protein
MLAGSLADGGPVWGLKANGTSSTIFLREGVGWILTRAGTIGSPASPCMWYG